MELSPSDISAYVQFIDKFDLISQSKESGSDGGDSAHRFSLIFVSLKLLGYKTWVDGSSLDDYYYKAMYAYEKQKDLYVRHPDPSKWYSNPLNCSRDQLSRLTQAMLVMDDKERIKGVAKGLLKRFGFNQNIYPNHSVPGDAKYIKKIADIATPSQVRDIIAGLTNNWFDNNIVLPILDIGKFADIYFAKKDDEKSKLKGKHTDYYVMLVTDIAVARATRDNFILRLAAKMLAKSGYRETIKWIFEPKWSDPPIDKLLLQLADRYIENAR